MSPQKVAFLGTPEIAAHTLRALHTAGIEVPLVVTGPDKRRGRGGRTAPSPVKAAAFELALPVSEQIDDVLASGADLGVVVAYGRLIRPHLLVAMPYVNLHFSLLPRWRGAVPVERAILEGDETTGVCLMEVTEGLDEGGVFARAETEVGDKRLVELRFELSDSGNDLLLAALSNGFGPAEPQRGEPVYAHKLTPEDRHIDWSSGTERILRVIRLGDAWTTFRGKRCKVLDARRDDTTVHGLVPLVVQPEGKAPMAFEAWRNGAQPRADEWFE